MRRMTALILLIFSLYLGGCSWGRTAPDTQTPEVVVRLASDLSSDDAAYRQLKRFAQKTDELSEGQIKIKLYSAGEWDDTSSLAEYLQTGTLEMAALSTARVQEFIPQYALYSYPCLFPTAAAVADYALSAQGQAALNINEQYRLIGFAANGYLYFQHLFAADSLYGYSGSSFYGQADAPVANALKQLNIRFTNEENNAPGLNHLASEGYIRHLVELNVVNESSYLTDPDIFYALEAVMVNQDFWQGLPAESQALLTRAFNESLKEECAYQANRALSEILPKGGISFAPWSADNKTLIYRYLRPFTENYLTESQNPLGSYFLPQAADPAANGQL